MVYCSDLGTSMNSNCYFPLPESWQYQSNFRTMSHDNSKTQLCHELNCRSHAHSISIAIAQLCWCRCSARWFLLEWLLLHFSSRSHSVVELTANNCFHAGRSHSHSWKVSCVLIRYWLVEWDIAITVTLHPYKVWAHGSSQAVSPTAWERG